MKRPHIIILNPDEMRWDAMGHMGNPAARTPFLDKLSDKEAVLFRRAYCQNPVCVPSRCSFLTGLYPHTRGHRTMQYLLREDEPSLFSELKDAGYYVWMNARNDLVAGQFPGLADRHASEIYYYDKDEKESAAVSKNQGLYRKRIKEETRFRYSHFEGLREEGTDKDWDDTRAACRRILCLPNPEKPLCLFLGWTNPHPPYQAEEPYFSMIDRAKIPPEIKFEETDGKSLMLKKLHALTQMGDYTETQWRELRAVYLAQCAKVDDMVKMVCDTLKEAGMYENSAIFFLSDHGDFCGDYGLPEKAQNTFEDCLTRVPLLIKPPKGFQTDAGITDSLAELVDFYATVMDFAGVSPKQDHFGRSLRPVLNSRSASVREFVCCEGGRLQGEVQCDEWHAEGEKGPAKENPYWPRKTVQLDSEAHEKGTMIFDGRYKYVHRPSGRNELYDLQNDPGERKNIYGSKVVIGQTEKMQKLMLDWYQQTCDIVPKDYDSRFTEEGLWAAMRTVCPSEMEEEIRKYLREESPGIVQAIRYVLEKKAKRLQHTEEKEQ